MDKQIVILNMKSRFLLSVVFFGMIAGLSASPVYRMGSYNIRGENAADTGDKDWNVRKEYVVRNIVEHDFDVVGLQENSIKMLPQLEELLGDDYATHSWGAISETSGTHTTIVYKAGKFTLLDKGQYFLTSNPAAPDLSWDTAVRRNTVWVKLQNKTTGDVFFYFSTHLDHKGVLARAEGARINVQKMQEIADGYPAIIVGDFNAYYSEKAMYNTFNAYLDDSRKVTQTAPVGPGTTFAQWNPAVTGGEPIDYVFCDRVNVLSYETITEDFGRGITPSDHLPILITCTFKDNLERGKWYVSTTPSAVPDGSKNAPFNNLQEAIDVASKHDTIFMTEGVFYPVETSSHAGRQATVNVYKSVRIHGGYDESFSSVVGKTELSGDLNRNDVTDESGRIASGAEDNVYHIMTVADSCFVELDGLKLTGGYADVTGFNSGAAIYSKGIDLILKDVELCDNYALAYGGAIYSGGNLNINRTMFARNQSGSQGGAFYLASPGWRSHISDSYFVQNRATQGSSGYSDGVIFSLLSGNTIADNVSSRNGVYTQTGESEYMVSTFVNNTFVNNRLTAKSSSLSDKTNGGSAIYFKSGSGSLYLVNNTIVGNTDSCYTESGVPSANFNGSAVHVISGKVRLVNNIIAGNFSSAAAAGEVYLGESASLQNSTYNLYGGADRMNITAKSTDMVCRNYDRCVQDLQKVLGSEIVDGKLSLLLSDNGGFAPTVKVKSVACGNNNLNVLSAAALRESTFYIDINDNGVYTDNLAVDGRGVIRNTTGSMIGAYEYTGESGMEPNVQQNSIRVFVSEDNLYVISDSFTVGYTIYNLSGSLQMKGEAVSGRPVDVSILPAGVYMVETNDRSGGIEFTKVLKNN